MKSAFKSTMFFLACVFFLISMPFHADADIFNCPSGDVTCLIDAINQSNALPGDHTINLASGNYIKENENNTDAVDGLNGLPIITGSVKIVGAGIDVTTIERDANAASLFRIFDVAASGNLKLEGLTVKGGNAGAGGAGGGILNKGILTIDGSKISQNMAGELYTSGSTGIGGGIASTGQLTIKNSFIASNAAGMYGYGGGISVSGSLTVDNTSFSDNFAGLESGGALDASGIVSISNSSFTNNAADAGGAIRNYAAMTIANTTFFDNQAEYYGGAIHNYGSLDITNCTFYKNKTAYWGGAIYNRATLKMQNTIIAGNVGENGSVANCDSSGGSMLSMGHNLTDSLEGCPITLLPTDITGDPKFGVLTDTGFPGGGHMPLLADSPAIDAGDNAVCQSMPTDQRGNPRIIDGDGDGSEVCDMGAVEYLPGSNVVLATNSGGGQFTDQSGVVYQADTGYSGGYKASTSAAISGTSDDTLYQSERYGNFSYNIPLANGSYIVTLKFAEIYWNAVGQRIFNVSMQGTRFITNLDIFSKVGKNAAYDVSVPVTVTNGTLNINFSSITDYAKISAIVITSGGGGQPTIALNPTSLDFSTTAGTNPANQNIALSNSGSETLNWTATANSTSPAWLSVSPPSGAGNATLTVSVNTAGLAAGTYMESITVAANGAANTPQTVNVTLAVNPTSNTVFAVNSGGRQFTDQSGVVYQADTGYSGGYKASTSAAISGTSDDTLYQSERYGNFSYNIPLANGNYTVKLKFAEIYWNAVGQRIFNVNMQGTQVINKLDIFSKVGKNAAYDESFPVSVTNGTLNIDFISIADYAKVSAIVITSNSNPTTNAVFTTNSGGGQFTDQSGVVYQADTGYSGGYKASTSAAISGTSDDTLYQSERYGNFSYNIPLANGNYTVKLKFAEIYWNAVGQRIFNVNMQGTQVINKLDIFSKVGKNAAYDESFPVSVTNGTLTINFSSVADYAKVSAIEVTPN